MKRKGFTLIELMIVIAIIAIIAAIAIPQLLRSRIGANETSAMGSLKAISAGQEQFRTASCVDANANGIGEYGFLRELSGAQVCRISGINVATSPYIPSTFNADISTKSGYQFATFLATAVGAGTNVVGAAPSVVGTDATSAAINEENYFCFAWPTTVSRTGNRVFVISPQGTVMQNPNTGATLITGTAAATIPEWFAALVTNQNWTTGTFVVAGSISQSARLTVAWAPIG